MTTHRFSIASFALFVFASVLGSASGPTPAGAQIIPLATEFQVNQDTVVCPQNSQVFARPDGGFGVVWADQMVQSIRGRFYDVDSVPLTNELTLQTGAGIFFEDVAVAPDGNFVTTWTVQGEGDRQVRGRRFDSAGSALGADFDISGSAPDLGSSRIAMDDQGEFVVVWTAGPYGSSSIEGRQFAANGAPIGSSFSVSSAVNSNFSDVAVDPDSGEFTVVWQATGNDADIYAKRYSSGGSAVGAEFVVNSYTTGFQRAPRIAMSTSGGMLVTWWGDTSGSFTDKVVLAELDAGGSLESEGEVGNSLLDVAQPSLAASRDGGSVVMGYSELAGGSLGAGADVRGAFNAFTDQTLALNETGQQYAAAVALDEADRATVVWLTDPDENLCASVSAVRGHIYRSLNQPSITGRVSSQTQQSSWKYYSFYLGSAGTVEVQLTGLTGDADLYVRVGALPSLVDFDCQPFQGGTNSETCLVPTDGTPLFIGVNGWDPVPIDFTLSAGPPLPLFVDGFESGDTSAWSVTVSP